MPAEPGDLLSTRNVYRLVDNYVRFVEDVWGRYWNVAASSLRRAVRIVEQGTLQPFNAERLFARLASEYANCISGLATSAPMAAELAAGRMPGEAAYVPGQDQPFTRGEAPRPLGTLCELAGDGADGPRTVALPARIVDASQGWAVYVVSGDTAVSVLGSAADVVTPFDIGGRRTLLAVLGLDHRVSDLGSYQEIALALAVTPGNDQARPPGAMFVGIGVSGAFSRDAGRDIWGIRKTYNPQLSASYSPGQARFGILDAIPGALTLGFPRFGTWRSANVPLLIYSRPASASAGNAPTLFSRMTLGGQGEGVQIGGSVSIRLGTANPAGCVCQGALDQCLCATLERFEVKDRLPAANGWTEHMTAALDAPRALAPQPLGNSAR